ncbi:GNAT family N-acetyltransferase [Thalassococcus sp. S3]|uniref:GNAT family N-acetyltransferase n=1 Tax=Thalassococcus sp. S3 TaxID=2017482 RepID=UPI00352DF40A
MYLKEVFVLPDAQGKGVGGALLSALLETADRQGCVRVDWQTDSSNPASQKLHTRIGAEPFEKISYRIARADFDAFRAKLDARGG